MSESVWANDNVVKSPFDYVDIPELTADQYIWRDLDKWSTKIAVVCGVTNRAYTYEEIYKKSRTLGANLRQQFKIKDGDVVAVMLPNVPEYPIVIHGILAAGGIASTFNLAVTSYEIQSLVHINDATLIITIGEIVPTVQESLVVIKKDIPIITLDIDQKLPEGTASFMELVEDEHVDLTLLNDVKRCHVDVALLPFSSGTTGLPKAVQITNRNIIAHCQQLNTQCRQYEYTTESHQDCVLVVLPLFHTYGLSGLMMHKMSAGLKLVTLPKFKTETFLNNLLNNKIQLLYVVPPIVMFLGSHPQVTSQHLENLTCVQSSAAPLSPRDIYNFLRKAQHNIQFVQCYGMTESFAITQTPLGHNIYEQVGYPLPNMELRVVDPEMRNLGPNELKRLMIKQFHIFFYFILYVPKNVGELLIRGPNVMKGYFNNPEADSEVFIEGDWLRTGDIGKIDETGLLTITDRLKELIKVKGFQVPPAELEGVLKEHPSILDAAVVGLPDPVTGEKPRAFVVLNQGAETTVEDIISFVNEKVAPYKKIKEVLFLETIPKNPSGKIVRRLLKDKYCY